MTVRPAVPKVESTLAEAAMPTEPLPARPATSSTASTPPTNVTPRRSLAVPNITIPTPAPDPAASRRCERLYAPEVSAPELTHRITVERKRQYFEAGNDRPHPATVPARFPSPVRGRGEPGKRDQLLLLLLGLRCGG